MNYKNIVLLLCVLIPVMPGFASQDNPAQQKQQGECTICMDAVPNIILGCSHSFCQECINQHKRSQNNPNAPCPICRTPISSEQERRADQCGVCLRMHNVGTALRCGHKFHEDCINNTVAQQVMHNNPATCPLCNRATDEQRPAAKKARTAPTPMRIPASPTVSASMPVALPVAPSNSMIKKESFFESLLSRKNWKYIIGSVVSAFILYRLISSNSKQEQTTEQ